MKNKTTIFEYFRFRTSQYRIHLGDTDFSTKYEPSSPIIMRVKEVRIHPRFHRAGLHNDIAILKLSNPVKQTGFITPICLPKPTFSKETLVGRRGVVVGWGNTRYGGKRSPYQKQLSLPIWTNKDCDRTYYYHAITNRWNFEYYKHFYLIFKFYSFTVFFVRVTNQVESELAMVGILNYPHIHFLILIEISFFQAIQVKLIRLWEI